MKIMNNDILVLKKKHVCNSHEWKVITSLADVKMQCLGCNRIVHVPRLDLMKRIKQIKRGE